jgi:hypothetical protein
MKKFALCAMLLATGFVYGCDKPADSKDGKDNKGTAGDKDKGGTTTPAPEKTPDAK